MYPSVQSDTAYKIIDKEGDRRYELANHLGNVLAVISDRKLGVGNGNGTNYTSFEAITISATDYFPFGMSMPGRSFTAANTEGYRYSFNGKEDDTEWAKQDYGARMYDKRLGRWLSIDPFGKKYPRLSPYNFVGNSPLLFIDPNGKEIIIHYLDDKGNAASYTFKAGLKPTSTNEFVQKAYEAITFVMKNDDSKTYQALVKASNKLNIYYRDIDGSHGPTDEAHFSKANSKGLSYSKDGKGDLTEKFDATVYWDPDAALKTTNGGGVSPATILFHEATHGKRVMGLKTETQLTQYLSDSNSDDPKHKATYGTTYDNPEEKRTIDIENTYIKNLNKGAVEYGKQNKINPQQEDVRSDHRGSLYKTHNVKSITPKNKADSVKGQQ